MATVTGTAGDDSIGVGFASAGVTPATGATEGADSITGLGGLDTISGGGGNDTINGGADNDYLVGGLGNDSILGGAGDDGIEGDQGNNTIDGGAGNDAITCSSNNDSLRGGSGNDFIDGGGGNDTLDGGTGADILNGNFGSDRYIVDNVGDSVFEYANEGNDTVESSISYTLTDNVENLILTGTAANGTGNALANSIIGNGAANRLLGLGGADTMDGGAGADTLVGGAGADRLIGGAGGDVFDFDAVSESTPAVSDTIAGIDGIGVAGGDRIDLQTIDANAGLAGNQAFILGGAFTAGHLRLTNLGSNTILEGNTDADAAAELRIVIEDGAIVAANYIAADFFL